MNQASGTTRVFLVLSAIAFACGPIRGLAETPGEIPKPWTYEGSMKLQEQQRQQDQQFQQQQSPQGGSRMAPGGGGAGAAAADAARAKWQKQPPLPVERNPLLGKWTRPASTRPNPNDPFGQLQALAKGGMCEALFGGGVFEFRPDRLVGMDDRTREQELDRVEYRGDARHVVVLPKTTLKLIEFDVDSPDRIHWTGQNCVLVRVAAAPTASTGSAPDKVANAAPALSAGSHSNTGGALTLAVSAASSTDNVSGRKLWVLKADPQAALIKGGLTSTGDGTVLQNWMRACQKREQACTTGAQALNAYSVGIATTDANGRAQTPPLPSGRYWVLSDAKVDNKRLMWNQPVDVKGADASLTLDRRNAMPVD
jgi:hypothetical protein